MKEPFIHRALRGLAPLYQEQRLLFFTILLVTSPLTVSHLILPDTPLYLVAGVGLVLTLYNTKNQAQRALIHLVSILTSIFLYITAITTTSLGLYEAVKNLLLLLLYGNTVCYFTTFSPFYVSEFYERFKHTCLAFTYGIAFAATISIMTFFIDSIFLTHWLSHQILQHSILAISSFFFLAILCAYQSPGEEALKRGPSKFYDTLINQYLPTISILSTVLAIIYLALMLLGLREDQRFLYTYYPYITIYYFFFMASYRQDTVTTRHRLSLLLFMGLTVLCIAFTVKRQFLDPAQLVSSIYPLLINGTFLLYNMHLYRSQAAPTRTFSYMLLALGAIMFTPLLGYTSYHEFVTYTKEGSHYVSHYHPLTSFYESKVSALAELQQEVKEKKENATPALSFHSDTHEPIPLNGYTQLYANQQLYAPSNATITAGGYQITVVHESNTLVVQQGDSQTTISLATLRKEEARGYQEDATHPISLTGPTFIIYVTDYYHTDRSTSLHFHFLHK